MHEEQRCLPVGHVDIDMELRQSRLSGWIQGLDKVLKNFIEERVVSLRFMGI